MTTDAFNPRSQRGFDLARSKHQLFRRLDKDTWIVPSATCSQHEYLVDTSRSTCTCPDAEDGGVICKHIWGVRYIVNEVTLIDGTHLAPPPAEDAEHTEASIGVQGGAP